ncbi:MAG: alpha/beta hydrolase [Clostridia bacterium]|nr:alpha/beta hydrolase [Clostridia bacterium]
MVFRFREVDIFYDFDDKQTEVVDVFLHGWGCNANTLSFCKNYTSNSTLFVDFPPFGKSGDNIVGWSVFTYANMMIALCAHLHINCFNLIGHSFGGRVAIIVASICKDKTNKLLLVDSAGLKPRRSLKYKINRLRYRLRKKMGKDVTRFASADYKAMPTKLKPVFCSIVNTHLEELLSLIRCKTLIVYGSEDKQTPLYMAKRLNRKIQNSKLVVLQGAGHFCFVDRQVEFVSLVKDFLKEG